MRSADCGMWMRPGTLASPLASSRPLAQHRLRAIRIGHFNFGVWRKLEIVMAKSKKKVETVFLVCEETGDYNYTLRRKSGGEKLKLSKYCPRLRKHTVHTEKKK